MSYKIAILQGDITERPVEAIVNAANTELILGAGVAFAIRQKGGEKIQQECNELRPLGLGEVAVTSGGKLPHRFILHAATMEPMGKTNTEIVKKCVENILKKSVELNLKSLALPALGCGVAGLELATGAEVILKTLQEGKKQNQTLELVEFVLFSPKDWQLVNALAQKLGFT